MRNVKKQLNVPDFFHYLHICHNVSDHQTNFIYIFKLLQNYLKELFPNSLTDHLQRSGLFEEFQSGFRVHLSTETELVMSVQHLQNLDDTQV